MTDDTAVDLRCPASTTETWASIPGSPGYEASDHGNVRSIDRTVTYRDGRIYTYTGRKLCPADDGKGYRAVLLPGRSVRVHTLVLEAFVGPRPAGMEACHGDGNRANNQLGNLRWDTPSANQQDSLRHGTHAGARVTHCPRGHAYDGLNLLVTAKGRVCRACSRARMVGATELDMQAVADRKYAEIMAFGPGPVPRTSCRRGHELFEANLQPGDRLRGIRNCFACRKASRRASILRSRGYVQVDFGQLADSYYAKIVAGAA